MEAAGELQSRDENKPPQHLSWGAWNDENYEKAKALFLGGTSARDISSRLGMSRNSVLGKMHRNGVKRPDEIKTKAKAGRPKLRIVRANTNSNAMRVLRSVEQGPRKISTAQTPPTIWIDEPQPKCCHYPYGDGPFVFCGLPTLDGYSYCSGHKTLCWVPPRERWA